MNKLLLTTAMVAMISTGAMAQSTVVTTTGTGHAAAVQIEPEFRTKIRTYVTEHKVRPVQTREKIIVGQPVPRARSNSRQYPPTGAPRSPSTATSTRANA
ncbi:sugar (pentulose or hexulose) kinase [Bradyrhizobium sp. LM6.11]